MAAPDPLQAFRLDGEVAVVTGGARGIGRAVAAAFARVGATVAICDRDADAGDAAAAEIVADGGRAEALALDVADEAGVAAAFDRLAATRGRIDVLVANAGLALRRPATELPLADWQKVVDVNLTGVFLCARAAARHMIAGGGGRIVATASIMGLSGGGLYPNVSYQATKGAIVNLVRALAVEWAPHAIRVNAVAPTWVRTDFIKPLTDQPELVARIEAMMPLRRLATVDDVVGAYLFLASRASAMVTGHVLAVDGGFLAQ